MVVLLESLYVNNMPEINNKKESRQKTFRLTRIQILSLRGSRLMDAFAGYGYPGMEVVRFEPIQKRHTHGFYFTEKRIN